MRLVSGAPLIAALLLTGCTLSPLARQTAAFSSATSFVVDNSEDAFRSAVRRNDRVQSALLVARYDTQPMDPHAIKHLIDAEGLRTRRTVLDGLRSYAQTVADLAGGVSSKQLDDASAAVGSNLVSLGSAVSATTPVGIAITPEQANGASTAMKALGEFLISRKINGSLPKTIEAMDPSVDALCKLLLDDIAVLRRQSGNDYEVLLMEQDAFIRHAGKDLQPIERRAEIERLPQILAEKQAADDMLADLERCVRQLALTHHALAAAAGKKDAPSLTARIAELSATGQRLASYYQSLPTATS
ncbi:MAG: hypothetical protein PW789_16050 [Edaphobacter sp.]|uniref:hypothetical protein n=1 Tax=Edaphobacter sp. TaxID=1934404 RepID=UPI00239767AA|nr:hypothetical protein [Edaphobacter sp.]MDE1178090.1 hypothetical protein [Edaphobacter sp.]